ncbi:low molecular weight protein-tyrosine-phosphatase [Pasteurella sp. PK-2025]|uniref:low molecular weight protein-tyrosine-phosphatase n=1 Tax=unclassified Pasteurella TaxID=2621516 RepID=UPI003C759FDF
MNTPIHILFVCLGNICRSPMAEYLMREKIRQAGLTEKIKTSSAGTSGWHDGKNMHCGTAEVLDFHRIPSEGFVSKKVALSDWQTFDYLIAMDHNNLQDLEQLFGHHPEKLFQITALCPDLGYDHIPDPWYTKNFQQTYQLLDRCCDALLDKMKKELSL